MKVAQPYTIGGITITVDDACRIQWPERRPPHSSTLHALLEEEIRTRWKQAGQAAELRITPFLARKQATTFIHVSGKGDAYDSSPETTALLFDIISSVCEDFQALFKTPEELAAAPANQIRYEASKRRSPKQR